MVERLEVPLLGQVPLMAELRQGSDDGHPIVAENPHGEVGTIFAAIAERIAVELAPTRRYNKALKLL